MQEKINGCARRRRSDYVATVAGLAVAAAALLPSEAAWAQTPAAGGAEPDAGVTVQDVIVTAQRREERQKDVPISITAQTGEQLQRAGVTSIIDLTASVPGLKVDQVGTQTQPALRGITSQGTTPGNDNNIAIYLDGVYQPNQNANNFDLPDVQRIEVLKGPQGTLFGRNAVGGAIQVFTLNPDLNEITGKLSASYGNLDRVELKGYASIPLVQDQLALGISAYGLTQDGYNDNLFTGDKIGRIRSELVRLKLLYRPSDRFELLLTGFLMEKKDASSQVGGAFLGNSIGNRVGAIVASEPHEVALKGDIDSYVRGGGASATMTADLGAVTLKSISSGAKYTAGSLSTGDYSSAGLLYYNTVKLDKTLSQEFQLSSNASGPLQWVVGAFAYYDKASFDPLKVISGANTTYIWSGMTTHAYAGFGEVTYDVTEALKVIAGARYSWEEKKAFGNVQVNNPVQPRRTPFRDGGTSWDAFTPRLSAVYKVTDELNVYATYSKGFKSGTYNHNTPNSAPVGPENANAWEAGFKAARPGVYTLNAAGFYYKLKDLQTNVINPLTQVSILQNAGAAEIYGADIDGTVAVSQELTLRAGVSLLHARYTDYPNANVLVPVFLPNGLRAGNVLVNPAPNLKGNAIVRSPDFTLNLTADYHKELAQGALDASATLYHTAKFYFDPGNRVFQGSYSTLAARVSFTPTNSPLRFSVWGRNLTNEDYLQGAFVTAQADGITWAPPRMYGVQIDYAF